MLMRLALALATMFLANIPVYAYQEGEFPGKGKEENFQKALSLYNESLKCNLDNNKALDLINKAITIYPYDAQFWYQYGMLTTDKIEKLKDLSKATSLNPDYIEPWYQITQIYCDSQKYDDAIKAAKKATSINPDDPTPWFILSNVYKEAGNFQESKQAGNKAKEIAKNISYKAVIGPTPTKPAGQPGAQPETSH